MLARHVVDTFARQKQLSCEKANLGFRFRNSCCNHRSVLIGVSREKMGAKLLKHRSHNSKRTRFHRERTQSRTFDSLIAAVSVSGSRWFDRRDTIVEDSAFPAQVNV